MCPTLCSNNDKKKVLEEIQVFICNISRDGMQLLRKSIVRTCVTALVFYILLLSMFLYVGHVSITD
jgi:hypothetical protein